MEEVNFIKPYTKYIQSCIEIKDKKKKTSNFKVMQFLDHCGYISKLQCILSVNRTKFIVTV